MLSDVASELGIDCAAVLDKSSEEFRKTKEELMYGRSLGVSGVPHFVMYSEENSEKTIQASGAQPPGHFAAIFDQLSPP